MVCAVLKIRHRSGGTGEKGVRWGDVFQTLKNQVLLLSVSTLLSHNVVSQSSIMYYIDLWIFFSIGLVRGILSGVAVDVGSNAAKQSDPSNGSQKPKAMTLLYCSKFIVWYSKLEPHDNFIVYYKKYPYSKYIAFFIEKTFSQEIPMSTQHRYQHFAYTDQKKYLRLQ